jgi:23S rRNA (guanosine2251-2'-O)-methyltransferase
MKHVNQSFPEGEYRFHICQCTRIDCRIRFPVVSNLTGADSCPGCGAKTKIVIQPYPSSSSNPTAQNNLIQIEGFLDNIRSGYNVGSIFRTADGAGLRHLHLAGITPTPVHPKVRKTALGAETSIEWTYYRNSLEAVNRLKASGYRIWALENGPRSGSVFDPAGPGEHFEPILLIVGNELAGVDPGLLSVCDRILNLPMLGTKTSLNVVVAFGIAVYQLTFGRDLE